MTLFHNILVKTLPLVPKPIVKFVSKRYVAGATIDAAVDTVIKLNKEGATATLDLLGESATNKEDCDAAVKEYLLILETIESNNLDCNISLKPTQLGLQIDKELCYQNIHKIVERADALNNFVRIDMEDSPYTSSTIEIFIRLKKEFQNVGIVLQAYMRRSLHDLNELVKFKSNFRLCKGIYDEARTIAFKDPIIINHNFSLLIEKALRADCYVGIATHDEKIVWEGLKFIDSFHLDRSQYEFQMLLGVDEELKKIILNAGHKLRIYVPYGEKWYAYSMRRLKENPKVAVYIIKAFFGIK
ncbi:proline dehydrogenase family protein [candidate division KSB1 bacterium]|nr:proline dehydrogenase family protein [candidate division KSB1 bacterium]